MKRAMTGLLAAMITTASAVVGHTDDKPVSIVLVHGAFVDASGWQAVHDILSADGYEVLAVQNPTITLASGHGRPGSHGRADMAPCGVRA